MSSKGPRSPQILKRSLKFSKVFKKFWKSSNGPQQSHHIIKRSSKGQLKVLMTSGAQMMKRSSKVPQNEKKVFSKVPFLNRSSNSSMSSKGPRSPHILKTSLKSSKRLSKYSQIPQVLSRSSDPRNVLNVPKVLESPQKQLKVHRFSGPQFQERSWKDPQKVLKSYSKCPQKGLKVLKMFWKSSKCPQSTQFLK